MLRTRDGNGGDVPPLPRRVPKSVPPARHPVTFLDDEELLGRVAERLRALDERRIAGLGRLN